MYPLNTVEFFWILLYEMTVILGVSGILLLIYREGFDKNEGTPS